MKRGMQRSDYIRNLLRRQSWPLRAPAASWLCCPPRGGGNDPEKQLWSGTESSTPDYRLTPRQGLRAISSHCGTAFVHRRLLPSWPSASSELRGCFAVNHLLHDRQGLSSFSPSLWLFGLAFKDLLTFRIVISCPFVHTFPFLHFLSAQLPKKKGVYRQISTGSSDVGPSSNTHSEPPATQARDLGERKHKSAICGNLAFTSHIALGHCHFE